MRVNHLHWISAALILSWGCHAMPQSRSADALQELRIEVKSVDRGQMYFCHASISLKNPLESPVWFLLPFYANDTLRRDGIFPALKWTFGTSLEPTAYDDDAGRAVLVHYYGDVPFYAILLPPHGILEFKDFVIESMNPPIYYDICEAESLKTDGGIPLERWFPYDIRSDVRSTISSGLHSDKWTSLDFEAEREGKASPSAVVRGVTAKILRCWRMPLNGAK